MEWIQVLVIIFSIAALVFSAISWQRSDLKAYVAKHDIDLKSMDAKQEKAIRENAKEMRDLVESNARENRSLISAFQEAIHLEMKDFHGRLCAIEEKYRSQK